MESDRKNTFICAPCCVLQVGNVGLTSLVSISQLRNLQQLHILNNERPLQLLPIHTSSLTSLSTLEIHVSEALTGLGSALGHLTSLRELLVPGCGLTELPESLSNLASLERVDLRGNHFQGFPGQLLQLPEAGKLRALDLSHNAAVYTLPDGVSRLVGLTYLGVANINLLELPAGITGLGELQRLNISFNALPRLPDGMGELKQLRQLSMLGCFEEFSPLMLTDQLRNMTGRGRGWGQKGWGLKGVHARQEGGIRRGRGGGGKRWGGEGF
jgi:Leucine-rich repeat (LRR) protein